MSDLPAKPPAMKIESVAVPIFAVKDTAIKREDLVSIEEPLEIQVESTYHGNLRTESVAVAMRTPGADEQLALGFLFAEGVIRSYQDVKDVRVTSEPTIDKGLDTAICVTLKPDIRFDLSQQIRHTLTNSSCGLCSKSSLDDIRTRLSHPVESRFSISKSALKSLPSALIQHQSEFSRTGGLHGCSTFNKSGNIERTFEDIGRHNALDKLIGSYVAGGSRWLPTRGVLLSGRASFELVQKSAMARIPLVAAIGPPSSLAIELAETQNMALIGFLRDQRFNVYCGSHLIDDL